MFFSVVSGGAALAVLRRRRRTLASWRRRRPRRLWHVAFHVVAGEEGRVAGADGLPRLGDELEGAVGGGGAVLVRVDEEGAAPELPLDGVARDGGGGGGGGLVDAEDGVPVGAAGVGGGGGVDVVGGERVGDAGERGAEPLGSPGEAVRAGDVAGEEELLGASASLLGLLLVGYRHGE